MAARGGGVHVATTKRIYKGKTYESHLLRRSFREDGKVKHETLGNISHLPAHIVQLVRDALRGTAFVPATEALEVVRSLPHGHVAAALGAARNLGFPSLLSPDAGRMGDIATALVVARVLDPRSKLATARCLRSETAASSLGQTLDLGSVTDDELYSALDWVIERQDAIERRLAKKHLDGETLVLYDVSGSYYTGTHCALAKKGYPRDGRKDFPQIVYGLLCNRLGCPLAVEVFEGNTADPKTLAVQVEKLQKRFGCQRIVLVGDRGTLTEARVREELRPGGLDWITALRAPAIQRLARDRVVQPSLFDEMDLAEISSPRFPDERLIACRNPLLAAERARKRHSLLQATEADLDKLVAATQRRVRALRGKDRIGIAVGRVLNRYKVGKHFKLRITETSFTYQRNTDRIDSEAALDGIYIIRTSLPKAAMGPEDAVLAYKGLAVVERAFRCLKTVDLKVRPIYHRLPARVRAHVFLCMLAYYVEWHMRQALAPLLFEDDDRASAARLRTSPVAPAQRSPAAMQKLSTLRTSRDEPVHSFRTLLQDLATIAKNSVRASATDAATFEVVTTPTPIQRRALELLNASVSP